MMEAHNTATIEPYQEEEETQTAYFLKLFRDGS